MLSMLLLLAATPQSAAPPMPAAPSRQSGATMRVIGETSPGCRSDVMRASDPTSPGSGPMWREGGEAVGLYRLLERRIDGCPVPVIVNYRVPGSNALGREASPGTTPAPVIVRRP